MDENNVELAKLEKIKTELEYFRWYLFASQSLMHVFGGHITETDAQEMFSKAVDQFSDVIRRFGELETEITKILVEEEG